VREKTKSGVFPLFHLHGETFGFPMSLCCLVLRHQKGEVSGCYPRWEYMAASLPLGSRTHCSILIWPFSFEKKGLRKHPLIVVGIHFKCSRPRFFHLRWLSNLIEKVGVVRAMNLCRSTSVHSSEYSNPRELELVFLGSMLMTPTY